MSYDWISSILDKKTPLCIVLTEGELSFVEIVKDDEWSTTTNEKNMMYKVYICGKILKLDERCLGDKVR